MTNCWLYSVGNAPIQIITSVHTCRFFTNYIYINYRRLKATSPCLRHVSAINIRAHIQTFNRTSCKQQWQSSLKCISRATGCAYQRVTQNDSIISSHHFRFYYIYTQTIRNNTATERANVRCKFAHLCAPAAKLIIEPKPHMSAPGGVEKQQMERESRQYMRI